MDYERKARAPLKSLKPLNYPFYAGEFNQTQADAWKLDYHKFHTSVLDNKLASVWVIHHKES